MASRFGHPSEPVIKHIDDVEFSRLNKDAICDVCPQAKQQRLKFPRSDIKTMRNFELVHIDLWGPYRLESRDGTRYFLTIVDDFYRATWAFLLCVKSHVLRCLERVFTLISNQFGTSIKRVRSDNGSEFLSNACQDLFACKGVEHQKSCAYTPEQNGVVERKHRHLLQVALSLLFQSSLPTFFLG